MTKRKDEPLTVAHMTATADENHKLRAELKEALAAKSEGVEIIKSQRQEITSLEGKIAQLHTDTADLKERLVTAENANQMMRGYIARVQEDDIVREELVETGDPHGEIVKVPKRRSSVFQEPSPYTAPNAGYDDRQWGVAGSRQTRPRHWILYG